MKILLADDHALFRDGMRYILNQLDEKVDVLDASNFQDAINVARDNLNLDLALLDLDMPSSEGVTSVKLFNETYPTVPIVVISGSEERGDIETVLNGGASGFISKSSPAQDMLHALRLVLDGGVYIPPQLLRQTYEQIAGDKRSQATNEQGLTPRQMDVLKQVALGLSNKEISLAIGLAEGTIKVHVAAIFQALRVTKRMEAVQAAKRLGLLSENNSNS